MVQKYYSGVIKDYNDKTKNGFIISVWKPNQSPERMMKLYFKEKSCVGSDPAHGIDFKFQLSKKKEKQ